jgi:branched-chain amino acid transport system ATP-binding protein
MLRVDNIHASYGPVAALRGVTLTVGEAEMVGLVGANGAGKSTLLRVVSGVMKPVSGTVKFEGTDIAGRTPESVVRRGISLVPEGRKVFPSLTVAENLRLGAATRRDRAEIQHDIDELCTRFPILRERFHQLGGTLSGGEQQQLAIARALMARPKLLMLDEPSLGLAPIVVDTMFEIVRDLRARGITVLLVEQNVRRTLAIVDRAYLMATGSMVFSGKPDELLRQVDIEASYLGTVDRMPLRAGKP